MKINRNSLYIQDKKKETIVNVNKIDTILLKNAKEMYNYFILNPTNNKYNNSIYFNIVQKKTKINKKLSNLFFLDLTLRKYFINLLNYQKFVILIENWFNTQSNQINQALKKINTSNNYIMTFYKKKKVKLLYNLLNRYKFFYIKEFISLIFMKNKNIKNDLENQIDLNLLKNKALYLLLNKTKNLLYINENIKKKNKQFISEYLNILKLIKKEYMFTFFNYKKTTDKTSANLIYKILYNKSYKEISTIAHKYNIKNVKEIENFLKIKEQKAYKLVQKKVNELENKHNWLQLYILFKTIKFKNSIIRNMFNLLRDINPVELKNNIILLNTNKQEIVQKIKVINKLNHICDILTTKNNNQIKQIYNKEFYYILYIIKNNYLWYTNLISLREIGIQNINQEKLNKKRINRIMNKIMSNANKKYGVTYTSILLNDQMYYWSTDYNHVKNEKYNHLYLINEIQKSNYKKQLSKFASNIGFSELIKIKNIKNALFSIKNKIKNSFTEYIIKKTKIILSIL